VSSARRFSGPEHRRRVTLGVVWFGLVALATFASFVNRPAAAEVPTKGAFYLVFFTIPGVLLAVVLIRRWVILIPTAVIAAAWSAWFSGETMRNSHSAAVLGILVTPMVAFVIVGVACFVDILLRPKQAAGAG